MNQRVVTIGRYEDIIQDGYEELKTIFNTGYHLIKRKEDKNFDILEFDWNKVQLLWLISEDYSNVIADIDFWKGLPTSFVLEAPITKDNLAPLDSMLELKELLGLTEKQVYVKIKNVEVKDDLTEIFDICKEKGIIRVVLDFVDTADSSLPMLDSVTTWNALAKRRKIRLSSNNHEVFNKPNKWILDDPAISGDIMADVLQKRMTRQPDTYNRENEYSHKAVELLGTGERYTAGTPLTKTVEKKLKELMK